MQSLQSAGEVATDSHVFDQDDTLSRAVPEELAELGIVHTIAGQQVNVHSFVVIASTHPRCAGLMT
jgi:hypothetical protein